MQDLRNNQGELAGAKVLLVDDDEAHLQLLRHIFTRAGSQVECAANGNDGLGKFYSQQSDLIILDLMMPQMSGLEFCSVVRRFSQVPIIMVTSLSKTTDIVTGLDVGAVDYVTKPYIIDILLARARAALRQGKTDSAADSGKANVYEDGYLTVDLDKRQVLVAGAPIKLSATEYRLLAYLVQNTNHVLTFEQILENVWGWEYKEQINYVHVYISHLRHKLEQTPPYPKYFLTEHGTGYLFSTQPVCAPA